LSTAAFSAASGCLAPFVADPITSVGEAHDATVALKQRNSAVGRDRSAPFDRYVAGLDREEHVACDYRRLVDRPHAVFDPRLSPLTIYTSAPGAVLVLGGRPPP
jgi:hypothetical protein